ncbi:MAG: DUF551 domain-containing protein, partial [Acinetobacter sp.]
MDIKKEREAFETWYRKNYDNSVIDDSEFSEILNEYESDYYWTDELNQSWKAWQAAKAHEAKKLEGSVVVPVQCPDPDFADSLFDELSKKAIGEFGDDLLIHFSDIDEEKIWALMVEAAKAQAVPEWISTSDRMPEEGEEVLVHSLGQVRQVTRDSKWAGGFKERN